MIHAAGILFQTRDGKILLLKRAKGEGDRPNLWALPGGKIEEGETPEDAAKRETFEEIGINWPGDLEEVAHMANDSVDYTTYLVRIGASFDPLMNAEHSARKWVTVEEALGMKLHPGVEAVLKKLRT